MTDDELERHLQVWFSTEIRPDEAAPSALRAALAGIPAAVSAPHRRLAPRRRIGMLAVAAVLTTLISGGILVGSGTIRPSPEKSPSDPAFVAPTPVAVASPSPSPELSSPSSSPEPCVTDSVDVLTGDRLPPVDRVGLEGLGQSRGVYLAGRPAMVWAANPGEDSSTLIASVSPVPNIYEVLDISPDGSNVLIRVGNLSPGGFTPECADVYEVRTDGSGSTRLTRFGTGRFVTGAAFSPDGRRVAFSWWAPDTLTTLDLQTGATIDRSCSTVYSSWPLRIDWSPNGDRIAIGCDRTLTIFDASNTTATAKFPMVEEPLAFSWTDDRRLIVASGGANIYSFDAASETSTVVGRFEDPSIEVVSGTGVFSPDGRWLAYHGGERGDVPGNDFTEVGYVVPSSGGTPTRIPGELLDTTWSTDSRALVTLSGQADDLVLLRIDVETLQTSTIGTISNHGPSPYQRGIWRVP